MESEKKSVKELSPADKVRLKAFTEKQKKSGRKLTVTMILFVAIAAALVIGSVIAVPKIVNLTKQVDQAATVVKDSVEEMNTVLDTVDNLVSGDADDFSRNLSDLISEPIAKEVSGIVENAMSKISNIDTDGINKTISDINSILKPLSKLVGLIDKY